MRRGVAALAAAVLLLVPLGLPSGAGATTTVNISGPFLANTVMATLAETYLATQCRDTCFRFGFLSADENGGIRKAAAGEVNIGTVARPTSPVRKGLRFTEFARQAVCVATNARNRLPNLTRAQVDAIFSGETRSWSEVPGAEVTGPIHVVLDGSPSVPTDSLERRLGLTTFSANAERAVSVLSIWEAVADVPTAITYLSPSTAEEVHLVPFNGVPCTRSNVESGRYPASTSLYWITKGEPKRATKKFLDWVETSPRARHSIESEAYAVR
jgi:phosphate transport system substrate-binding protein